MSELVADCPRCGAKKMTFDLKKQITIEVRYDWQNWLEAFCVCRKCDSATIFTLIQKEPNSKNVIGSGLENFGGAVNKLMHIEGYVSLKDTASKQPPEYIPEKINAVFKEGATCMAIGCPNAAGTMFRLCIDLSTRAMLPEEEVKGLNSKIRHSLGLRLPWLFDNKILPEALRELSSCVKDDGNDGAHEGTLKKEDAEDLLDFTYALLERIYTEPQRIKLANERRLARRESKSPDKK
ncbi:MAG: DUF4145 domain-containing protein [Candidatus Omnitrophica bacterium]|nr:DUF4145 domain-containing protein [Candidatus Omnitrophota bacterium]MBU1047327.1 DUF4145 domain-containing protein [Candidatus Omnitrophota bacterium]MBU1630654.1 DUF4145 domain-containing protein [Candidatus Omnitrophota bacterium]MBU1767765.1 DUF4145 domain-containing protein [Candidatus Omnitrophota bacterium]MBU1889088.1 DUF4145 domain-containing protein [Candidatus Omnitrophota bacterium]